MKRQPIGKLLLILPMLASLVLPVTVQSENAQLTGSDFSTFAGSQVRVLGQTPHSITLEFTVNHYQVVPVIIDEQVYQQVMIAGLEQSTRPGLPQLPLRGELVSIPSGVVPILRVLESNENTISSITLPPAPIFTLDGFGELKPGMELHQSFDADSVAIDLPYPYQPALLGEIGSLRSHPFVRLEFAPVQILPDKHSVRIYRRIVTEISWTLPDPATTTSSVNRFSDPVFDRIAADVLLGLPPATSNSQTPYLEAGLVDTGNAPQIAPKLKVTIPSAGIYHITSADLSAAGLNPAGIDPRTIKISHRDVEVPIWVEGQSDGVLDPQDQILFYGKGINDIYTNQDVYLLTYSGANGLRMQENAVPPGGAEVPADFTATLHAEQDTFYWQNMAGGGAQDHWFWEDRISPNAQNLPISRTYTITLDYISQADGSDPSISYYLKGATNIPLINPDHLTQVFINNTSVGDVGWDGTSILTRTVIFPRSLLQNGPNLVRFQALPVTGVSVDQAFINWFEINYRDTFTASGDMLEFTAPSNPPYKLQVSGFTSGNIWALDITNPDSPVLLTQTLVTSNSGTYQLSFQGSAPGARFLTLSAAQLKTPSTLILDQPTNWKSPEHSANYILITHDDFYTTTLPLANHRSASGLNVAVVNVQDLYDEFNGGIFNPSAIRDFLSYAYTNWAPPAPQYVMLVGDAYLDYKDNFQTGTVNYVPTQVVDTVSFGETASDNWYVAIDGNDPLPEMHIGRISIQSVNTLPAILEKIYYYEQNPPPSGWNKNALFIADDNDTSFEYVSNHLAAQLPLSYTANKIYVEEYYPPDNPTADISDKINSGSLLVNYIGHGAVHLWGKWDQETKTIYGANDVNNLNNNNKYPLVTVGNCLSGYFASKNTVTSMAEVFQRAGNKGAIAIWAPTGTGITSSHYLILSSLYDSIFQNDMYSLGAATTAAKANAYARDNNYGEELVHTFVLFGDPATKLGLPTNYPYILSTSPANGTIANGDQPIQVVFSKPMQTGSVQLTGGGVTFTASWDTTGKIATFDHPSLQPGQSYTLTVSGNDKISNSLGDGLVPNPFTFTVASSEIYMPLLGR